MNKKLLSVIMLGAMIASACPTVGAMLPRTNDVGNTSCIEVYFDKYINCLKSYNQAKKNLKKCSIVQLGKFTEEYEKASKELEKARQELDLKRGLLELSELFGKDKSNGWHHTSTK